MLGLCYTFSTWHHTKSFLHGAVHRSHRALYIYSSLFTCSVKLVLNWWCWDLCYFVGFFRLSCSRGRSAYIHVPACMFYVIRGNQDILIDWLHFQQSSSELWLACTAGTWYERLRSLLVTSPKSDTLHIWPITATHIVTQNIIGQTSRWGKK